MTDVRKGVGIAVLGLLLGLPPAGVAIYDIIERLREVEVSFRSTPSEAEVYIEGEGNVLCETPCDKKFPRSGTVLSVIFRKDGHQEARGSHSLDANGTIKVDLALLQCKSGRIPVPGGCCWPGQWMVEGACRGKVHFCPPPLVLRHDNCLEPSYRCPIGYEETQGRCIRSTSHCVNGARRNEKGHCIDPIQPCPNGTRRNTEGECLPPLSCPKGMRRSKNGLCISRLPKDMVKVQSGRFIYGCHEEESDRECLSPPLNKRLPTFYIDRYEATVEDYARCVRDNACSIEGVSISYNCNWQHLGRSLHPMNCINWYQADAYCGWQKKRLPTEYEWEKAARGTDGRTYPWGNDFISADGATANVADRTFERAFQKGRGSLLYNDGVQTTSKVGSFPLGRSVIGAEDMAGNIVEWTASWYSEENQRFKVMRGGSWYDHPRRARTTARMKFTPESRGTQVGVRCVRD